jgi:hypothetical protein
MKAKHKQSRVVSRILFWTSLFFLFSSAGCTSVSRPDQYEHIYHVFQDTSTTYYKVAFLAYNPGTEISGKKSIAGHASILIDDTDIWGFYPSTQGKIFTRQGALKKNTEHPEIHEYVDFTVDNTIMDEIRELINKWEQKPPSFAIPVQDCVSFIYRICDIIGLRYNRLSLIPSKAVRSIRKFNDQDRVYRGRPVPALNEQGASNREQVASSK